MAMGGCLFRSSVAPTPWGCNKLVISNNTFGGVATQGTTLAPGSGYSSGFRGAAPEVVNVPNNLLSSVPPARTARSQSNF